MSPMSIFYGMQYPIVLGGMPEIPYTVVFSSNHFKDINFQIYLVMLAYHEISSSKI